MQHLNFL